MRVPNVQLPNLEVEDEEMIKAIVDEVMSRKAQAQSAVSGAAPAPGGPGYLPAAGVGAAGGGGLAVLLSKLLTDDAGKGEALQTAGHGALGALVGGLGGLGYAHMKNQ